MSPGAARGRGPGHSRGASGPRVVAQEGCAAEGGGAGVKARAMGGARIRIGPRYACIWHDMHVRQYVCIFSIAQQLELAPPLQVSWAFPIVVFMDARTGHLHVDFGDDAELRVWPA